MTRFLVIFLIVLSSAIVNAQPPGDPGGGSDPDVPITGIEILLGLGGFIGVKKIWDRKTKSK